MTREKKKKKREKTNALVSFSSEFEDGATKEQVLDEEAQVDVHVKVSKDLETRVELGDVFWKFFFFRDVM